MTLRRAWDEEHTYDIKYQTTQISFLLTTRGQSCVNIEIQISTIDWVLIPVQPRRNSVCVTTELKGPNFWLVWVFDFPILKFEEDKFAPKVAF